MLGELFSPQRFPQLTWQQRWQLLLLRYHRHAPIYHNFSGHRLNTSAIAKQQLVNQALVSHGAIAWDDTPLNSAWLKPWLAQHTQHVPYFAALKPAAAHWHSLPTMHRECLTQRLNQHVPADILRQPALLCFSTSGTTGHPIHVPSVPTVAAQYAAYHQRALATQNIVLRAQAGSLGVALVGYQKRCFTYVSVNPFNGSGLVKINLMPHDWRRASDRAAYLNALRPELITGDPLSLAKLASLALTHRPKAILSTSMALSIGLRESLAAQFACPVIDVYSMNEAGPIAVYVPHLGGHLLLQPELFIEILDENGLSLPAGQRGEITLTGGFNPCLPRYRTGDYASKISTASGDVLMGLEGRSPVRFQTTAGQWVNNVDITQALHPQGLIRFSLHQAADGALTLALDPLPHTHSVCATIRSALSHAFLKQLPPLRIVALRADDKIKQYRSDLTAGKENNHAPSTSDPAAKHQRP
jgi:phenylacetate-CoA ligase